VLWGQGIQSAWFLTLIIPPSFRMIIHLIVSFLLLLLLLKSMEVNDDVALLMSCTVLGSMCIRRWLCSPNWQAQVLPQWGHCGPVFGFVAAVWYAARRSSEAASQSLTKCARPASQVAFHTTRSLARVSRPLGLMWHLRRFILMWSMNRFFGRPTDRCSP